MMKQEDIYIYIPMILVWTLMPQFFRIQHKLPRRTIEERTRAALYTTFKLHQQNLHSNRVLAEISQLPKSTTSNFTALNMSESSSVTLSDDTIGSGLVEAPGLGVQPIEINPLTGGDAGAAFEYDEEFPFSWEDMWEEMLTIPFKVASVRKHNIFRFEIMPKALFETVEYQRYTEIAKVDFGFASMFGLEHATLAELLTETRFPNSQLLEQYGPEHYVFDLPSIADQLSAEHYGFRLDPSGEPLSRNPFIRTQYHEIHEDFLIWSQPEFRELDEYLKMLVLSKKLDIDIFRKLDAGLVKSLSPEVILRGVKQMMAVQELTKSKKFSFESYHYKAKLAPLSKWYHKFIFLHVGNFKDSKKSRMWCNFDGLRASAARDTYQEYILNLKRLGLEC
ncbi:hypothetical protein DFH27DRAFT_13085 [Peziza echinospora]|nr:hypothetical protein DFH27DRAFT_13085 [Peziza echinospora]